MLLGAVVLGVHFVVVDVVGVDAGWGCCWRCCCLFCCVAVAFVAVVAAVALSPFLVFDFVCCNALTVVPWVVWRTASVFFSFRFDLFYFSISCFISTR